MTTTPLQELEALIEAATKACPADATYGTQAHVYWLSGINRARIDIVAKLPSLLAELKGCRSALERAGEFISYFKEKGVEQLCEGVHAGLRKGTEAHDAGHLCNIIARSQSSAWSDAIEFAHDPFFSMWGGDEALQLIATALSNGEKP